MTDDIFDRNFYISLYENNIFEGRNLVMKTWKNKLCAIVLLVCGNIGVLLENDATAIVFFAMIAIPLIFAKENWVY